MSRYANYECLKIEVAVKVATVTLNRPQAMNALSKGLMTALAEAAIAEMRGRQIAMTDEGAAIIARGVRQDDGSIDAQRILVGKDGLVPPMWAASYRSARGLG